MKDYTIATTTWYPKRDPIREDCAIKSIVEAGISGYDIVVVDGGSSKEFLKEMDDLGAKVYAEEEKGMGKGRRQALRLAKDNSHKGVIWTEPEKYTLVDKLYLATDRLEQGADIIVPKRMSLESYPEFQQHAEKMGNQYFKDRTKMDLDMWIGTRAIDNESIKYFLEYDGEYGDLWDSIFIPVLDAAFDGKAVGSVDVNYEHPSSQTGQEANDPVFHQKRVNQLTTLIEAIDLHCKKNGK